MLRSFLALLMLIATSGVYAQSDEHAADHNALRKLKGDLEQAVSKRDFDAAQVLFHKPFMATVVTQESFTDLASLKTYFDGLFSRELLRMKEMSIHAKADELSKIYTGTFALTRGSTQERYELADGRAFEMQGRWTAISIKEPDGNWKILGIHSGTNFLDNPVLSAIERSALWLAAGCGFGGLLMGIGMGWFFWRRSSAR
ncbi:hypothetical protein [Niveibacterium sp. COAC-50]|uniref:YybH family protein n=1 Tax=Niveibacterium sp. COAC-50 TaxID=2729384 RepID=UPI0015540886|nr:hypothetical protein [Niveibacterium sp. COAC-50]